MAITKAAVEAAAKKVNNTQGRVLLDLLAEGSGALQTKSIHHKTVEFLKNLETIKDARLKTEDGWVPAVKLTAFGKKVAELL